MASTGEAASLGERFESGPNALNFLRLCLALNVVIAHAYALRGSDWLPAAMGPLLGGGAVDSFFAISGFLIVRAWCRSPNAGRYLLARAARILPGLWVCLLLTAFVIAPAVSSVSTAGQWRYVLGNADTWGTVYDIDGGPYGVPHPGAWNGSIWSLGYETGCYLAVLTLGIAGALRAQVVFVAAVSCWILSAGLAVAGVEGQPTFWPRCGLMFAVGALGWFQRDRIRVTRVWGLAAAFVTIAAIAVIPAHYWLIAAPAVAYLCLAGGVALGRNHRLVFRKNDLSYGVYIYSFPLQQCLLLSGVSLGWAGFAGVSVGASLVAAAASWFVVERPAMRLGHPGGTARSRYFMSQRSHRLHDRQPSVGEGYGRRGPLGVPKDTDGVRARCERHGNRPHGPRVAR